MPIAAEAIGDESDVSHEIGADEAAVLSEDDVFVFNFDATLYELLEVDPAFWAELFDDVFRDEDFVVRIVNGEQAGFIGVGRLGLVCIFDLSGFITDRKEILREDVIAILEAGDKCPYAELAAIAIGLIHQ